MEFLSLEACHSDGFAGILLHVSVTVQPLDKALTTSFTLIRSSLQVRLDVLKHVEKARSGKIVAYQTG